MRKQALIKPKKNYKENVLKVVIVFLFLSIILTFEPIAKVFANVIKAPTEMVQNVAGNLVLVALSILVFYLAVAVMSIPIFAMMLSIVALGMFLWGGINLMKFFRNKTVVNVLPDEFTDLGRNK